MKHQMTRNRALIAFRNEVGVFVALAADQAEYMNTIIIGPLLAL